MSATCSTSKKNLGKSKCVQLPKLMRGMITTPESFKLAPSDYATQDALKTALQSLILNPINSRGYLWPLFSNVEDVSETAQYEDTPLSVIPIRDGQYRYKPMINKNLCLHKAMFSHRAVNEGRVFFLDLDNQLFGTEDEAGNIMGFKIGLLHTEKLRISNGSNSTVSPIYVVLSDNEEIDRSGVLIDGSAVNTVERLTDVSITSAGAQVTTGFKVDVKQSCDGVPVSGLLVADFVMYATDGVTVQTIASAAEDANTPGRYNILAPAGGSPNPFEDGTLTLRAPSALTVKAYECNTPLTVDV
jgi:hypothetical protein